MLCVTFFHIPNPSYHEKRQQRSGPCLNDRTPSLRPMKPARLHHPCLKRAQQADHQGSAKSSLKYNSASILQRVGFQWQVLLNDGSTRSRS